MRTHPECFPCVLRLVEGVARASFSEGQAREFVAQIAALPAFVEGTFPATSAHLVAEVWAPLVAQSGRPDPLRDVRKRQTQMALAALPAARDRVRRSPDPLELALRFAIAGNKLDAMVGVRRVAVDDLLELVEGQPLDRDRVDVLRGRLETAETLLYLGDNCGEVVFDRLLLEVLAEQRSREVTYVTRNLPMANDALIEDALEAGIDRFARIIPNGIPFAFPGTDLANVSPDVAGLLASVDLVISKGVANYETLEGEPSLAGRVSFLLEAKCAPICREHEAALGDFILCNA